MSTKSTVKSAYPTLFSIFFLFLLFPASFFLLPGRGPSASGAVGLHLARAYGLVFGKDIDTLYGPLAILHTRLRIAVNPIVYLLFDGYFLVSAYLILRNILRKHFHFGVIVFIFLAIVINITASLNDWFFYFLLYYLFAYLKEPRQWRYVVQGGILAVITLYSRVDTGLFAVALYLSVTGYSLIRKRLSWRLFAVSAGCFLVAVLLSAWALHVNLPGYIQAGLHLLSDYGEARFQPAADKEGILFHLALEVMLCVVYWIVCLVVLACTRRDARGLGDEQEGGDKRARGGARGLGDELFICGIIGMAAIVFFKYDFVRSDDGEVFRFFGSVALLIAFLFLYAPPGIWRRVAILGCWIVLGISVMAVNLDKRQGKPPIFRLLDLSIFSEKLSGIGNYFSGIRHYNQVSAEPGQAGDNALKAETVQPGDRALRAVVGNASIDIIPWEIYRIWADGLRYDPRPVNQSFNAYNGWLDSLNYAKYLSSGAPSYVLLSFNGLDGHFPFFDEARTKLALLSRYDVVTDVHNELLLKNADRHRLVPAGEETADVRLNTDIPIPRRDSMLQFSRFYIRYDQAGKFGRWRNQPPGLKITLTLDDGSSFTYRISKSVLEDGIIVNKYVDGGEELQLLMQSHGKLTSNISRINIRSDSPGHGFTGEVAMVTTLYTWSGAGPMERAEDSSGIVRLYDRSRPESAVPDRYHPADVRYRLDEFNTFSQFVRVRVALPWTSAMDSTISVRPVLRSRDHFFVLPYLKQTGSWGISVAAKDLLPPGDYELGLAKDDRPGGKEGTVEYTGRHLLLRSNYKIFESGPIVPVSEGNTEMKYNIDLAATWKGQVLIEGWAKFQKKDTGKTTTTIVLSSPNRTYRLTTDPVERTDVGGPGDYCGFSVRIPTDRLAEDRYIVAIDLVCCGGRLHNLQFSSLNLKTGRDNDTQIPFPASTLPPTLNFPSGIDRYTNQREFMIIEGWAIGDWDRVGENRIDVVLQSDSAVYLSSTIPEIRSDITAHYHNGHNLDSCGFSAKISKEELPAGKYRIGLWVRPKNGPGWIKYTGLYTVNE